MWIYLLGGLIVWAAHFFALYIVANLFPGSGTARWLAAALTVPALAANALLLWRAMRARPDPFERWVVRVGAVGAALSLAAVGWQALPVVLV